VDSTFMGAETPERRPIYAPRLVEYLSADEFAELISTQRHKIKGYRIRPPTLGDTDCPFGAFEVEFKVPRLVAKLPAEDE
jgi:hypothetical protein